MGQSHILNEGTGQIYDDMFFINTLVNVLVGRVINDWVKDGNNSFEIVPAFEVYPPKLGSRM